MTLSQSLVSMQLKHENSVEQESVMPESKERTLISGVLAPDFLVVDFDDNDPADPLKWPTWHKWIIVTVLSLLSAFVQLSIVMVAPLTPQIQRALHTDGASYATLLVTVWELGEVVGPLIYGPLSEHFGRLPVIHFSAVLFALFSTGCALSVNTSMLLALRFLNGTSVAVVSLSGAIVSDLFVKEQRGAAISAMMVGSRVGPALGPIIGGAVGESKGWRWAFWVALILSGAGSCVLLLVYRETYRVKILDKKVQALRRSTGNVKLVSKYQRQESGRQLIVRAVFRPAYLITHSWVLAGLSIYVSIYLGLFYLALTTIAPTFTKFYGFSESQTGLAYLGLYVGMIIGAAYFTTVSKLQVRKSKKSSDDSGGITPEHRLTPSALAAVLVSAGFFLFGWSTAAHRHWIAPIIGTALIGFGYFITTVSIRAYIVDAFGTYAASASAAMLATRNIPAALLPLAGPPLFARLGLGWGSSLLAFLSLLIMPVPLIFMKYGARIRRASSLLIQD